DHVRAVEHQGLVALALEPAVVLLGEIELLERGSHGAVEDDDARVDRLQVVAHREHASGKSANLDTALARFVCSQATFLDCRAVRRLSRRAVAAIMYACLLPANTLADGGDPLRTHLYGLDLLH